MIRKGKGSSRCLLQQSTFVLQHSTVWPRCQSIENLLLTEAVFSYSGVYHLIGAESPSAIRRYDNPIRSGCDSQDWTLLQVYTELPNKGTFHQDLFYRINVIPIKVPPLKERYNDIAPLVMCYFHKYCTQYNRPLTITPTAMEFFGPVMLEKYPILSKDR
jgi:hypothetical protein